MDQALRVDKWLWFARLAKSRSVAQKLIEQGGISINFCAVAKASQMVRPGDELALLADRGDRRLRVLALGERRGPATEAQMLYEDLVAE